MPILDYTVEQIIDNCCNYEEIYQHFLSLLEDEERKEQLKQAMYEGKIGDYVFTTSLTRDNPMIEGKRRISMAYLLVSNPKTVDALVANKIDIFHGTSSSALPSILEFGMHSHKDSERLGIYVSTGETWSRIGGEPRDYISFTDILDVAEGYGQISAKKGDTKASFPIVIGTKKEELLKDPLKISRKKTDTTEVEFKGSFPTERIHFIMVPSDKIEIIKKMVGDRDIQVIGIDNLDKKFYYMKDDGEIMIIEEQFNNFKKSVSEKQFQYEEINELAKSRTLDKIRKIADKFSSWKKRKGEKDDRKTDESIYGR